MLPRRLGLLLSYASLSSAALTSSSSSASIPHPSKPPPVLPIKPYDSTNHVTISYVTDIEGNLDYWQRFKKLSKVLYTEEGEEENHHVLALKENCHLVFGGDVCDRGPADLRIIDELLALKRRYPSNVHFILGNRDVNKLR